MRELHTERPNTNIATKKGFDSIVDRYNRDRAYAVELDHRLGHTTKRRNIPFAGLYHPARGSADEVRSLGVQIDRRGWPPYWNYREPNSDGEVEHVSVAACLWSWDGSSWGSSSWSGRWH